MSNENFGPDFSLSGKVAFITGASRGIGRACALACAAAGANIVLGLRNVSTANELISEIGALGGKVLPLKLDLTSLSDIDSAVAAALDHFGRLDVLVNNVGIAPGNLAEDVNEQDFDATLAVNLKGTFFMTQAVGRTMMAQKSGRIINISSQAGTVTLRGEAIYCMTKAAINHLTRCLAAEWGPYGITVNAVAPTFVWTDSTTPSLSQPEFLDRTVARIPLGRIGETKDVVGAVVFLASPASSLITGINLLVDGGWSVT
jgi:NAD(P)-dependent dehydrogenase (short-subunit alcohol dehydrogenase family)